jgi:hypothetical protein
MEGWSGGQSSGNFTIGNSQDLLIMSRLSQWSSTLNETSTFLIMNIQGKVSQKHGAWHRIGAGELLHSFSSVREPADCFASHFC